MRLVRFVLLALVLAAPLARPAAAQSSESTRARMAELQRQLDSDRSRLQRALEAEQITTGTLDALDREVAAREALVVTYGMRLEQVRAERDSLARTLGLLTNQFVGLRARQAALARQAYKHGRLNDLVLLFSARSISEMVRRARFLRRISDVRKGHATRMESTMQTLQARQGDLAKAERDATRTLGDATTEQRELAESQRRRAIVVDAMRSQRGVLEDRIGRVQADMASIERTVESVSREGTTRRAAAPAEDRAAYDARSRAFAGTRGQLAWPVAGFVTQRHGVRTNAETGIETRFPGIMIGTEPEALVRAVAAGRVERVGHLPEFGQLIVIVHGDYITTYSNLSALAVRRGDEVAAGQVIAKAGTDQQPMGAGLFFTLSVGNSMQDPIPWLRAQ